MRRLFGLFFFLLFLSVDSYPERWTCHWGEDKRGRLTVGMRMAARMPMIAMTVSSSMRVKPARDCGAATGGRVEFMASTGCEDVVGVRLVRNVDETSRPQSG